MLREEGEKKDKAAMGHDEIYISECSFNLNIFFY